MNYLIVKLSSLGDIIMATPCIRAIRQKDPDSHIAIVVSREYIPLVQRNPHLNEILIRETEGNTRRIRTVAQAVTTFARRNGPRFDLAFDLQGNFHSATWVYCSGARTKAGLGGRRPGWSVRVPVDLSRHSSDLCAAVLRECGIPVSDLTPELSPCANADRTVIDLLQRNGLPDRGFLVISPFSQWRSKEWPLDRYATLIRHLVPQYGLPIVVTGSATDAFRAAEISRHIEGTGAVSLVGTLDLDQALSVYQRARLMITSDSGPMHAAAALGTPVVALFGPTWPETTGPWGIGHQILQTRRPPTHTAYREADGQRYMLAIDLDDVCQAVEKVLGGVGSGQSPF